MQQVADPNSKQQKKVEHAAATRNKQRQIAGPNSKQEKKVAYSSKRQQAAANSGKYQHAAEAHSNTGLIDLEQTGIISSKWQAIAASSRRM